MKKLFIFGHQNMQESFHSKAIYDLIDQDKIIIYDLYPDFKIDIEKEHERLAKYDELVFVSPVNWYTPTPIIHQYINLVFDYGFGYGKDAIMRGVPYSLILTSGGRPEFYSITGKHFYPFEEFQIDIFQSFALMHMPINDFIWIDSGYTRPKDEQLENIKEKLANI